MIQALSTLKSSSNTSNLVRYVYACVYKTKCNEYDPKSCISNERKKHRIYMHRNVYMVTMKTVYRYIMSA